MSEDLNSISEEPGLIIEDKKEPIKIGRPDEEPELNEEDPRAAIYKKVAEQRAAEIAESQGQAPAPQDKEGDPEDPGEDGEEEDAPMVEVTVNGKKRMVDSAKIEAAGGVYAYQKQAAASEMLNHASTELRRVQQLEQEVQARRDEVERLAIEVGQARDQQRTAPSLPETPGAMKELARKYHESIMDGDLETADDLLVQMQGARSNATPNTDEIARKAAATVIAENRREKAIETANNLEKDRLVGVSTFETNYADIASDPELRELADIKTLKIVDEHPDWTPSKIIEEAAKEVRKWVTGRGIATHGSGNNKLNAKRSQTNVRGSSSAKSLNRPAPPPETNSQYVERLRKQRGLE